MRKDGNLKNRRQCEPWQNNFKLSGEKIFAFEIKLFFPFWWIDSSSLGKVSRSCEAYFLYWSLIPLTRFNRLPNASIALDSSIVICRNVMRIAMLSSFFILITNFEVSRKRDQQKENINCDLASEWQRWSIELLMAGFEKRSVSAK